MVLLVEMDTPNTLTEVEAFVSGHGAAEVEAPGRKASHAHRGGAGALRLLEAGACGVCGYVSARDAEPLDEFTFGVLPVYPNCYRPCHSPEDREDGRGKTGKIYRHENMRTPQERPNSPPEAAGHLRAGRGSRSGTGRCTRGLTTRRRGTSARPAIACYGNCEGGRMRGSASVGARPCGAPRRGRRDGAATPGQGASRELRASRHRGDTLGHRVRESDEAGNGDLAVRGRKFTNGHDGP